MKHRSLHACTCHTFPCLANIFHLAIDYSLEAWKYHKFAGSHEQIYISHAALFKTWSGDIHLHSYVHSLGFLADNRRFPAESEDAFR
jgi:hypothetical protein